MCPTVLCYLTNKSITLTALLLVNNLLTQRLPWLQGIRLNLTLSHLNQPLNL